MFDQRYLAFGISFLFNRYPEKKARLTHRQVLQPRTETIVYNRLVEIEKNLDSLMKIFS